LELTVEAETKPLRGLLSCQGWVCTAIWICPRLPDESGRVLHGQRQPFLTSDSGYRRYVEPDAAGLVGKAGRRGGQVGQDG